MYFDRPDPRRRSSCLTNYSQLFLEIKLFFFSPSMDIEQLVPEIACFEVEFDVTYIKNLVYAIQ